jgi:hypothetical protein
LLELTTEIPDELISANGHSISSCTENEHISNDEFAYQLQILVLNGCVKL